MLKKKFDVQENIYQTFKKFDVHYNIYQTFIYGWNESETCEIISK